MRRFAVPAVVQRLVVALAITLGITAPVFGQSRTSFTSGTGPAMETYKVDVYPATAAATKLPVVVLLHGIDGMGLSGPQITDFARQLEKEGYLVLVPHYFDKNDGDDSLPITDLFTRRTPRRSLYVPRIADAVKHAIGLGDADKTRVGLVGFSLGGGLALEHAESQPGTIKGVVDFFGFIKNTTIIAQVAKLPPTLVLHNQNDDIVPVDESSKPLLTALDALMGAKAVVHDHKYYVEVNPPGNHQFKPGGAADIDSRKQTIQWLTDHVKK
jgi:dienelactone hydrolase